MVNQIVDFAPKLKKLLNECGSSFKFTCLDAYITQVEFFEKHNIEDRKFPQIFHNGKRIGGYSDLKKLTDISYDYNKLHEVTKIVTENLNKVIDVNFYPTTKTRTSNMLHRPIGIGVQGLADTFAIMNIPFHSEKAKEINRNIFETIYHGALEKSMEIAMVDGPYSSFNGSPASKGILQFDMWNVNPTGRYDWNDLKEDIMNNGIRNSLLLAPMPTASTSQILGFNECF